MAPRASETPCTSSPEDPTPRYSQLAQIVEARESAAGVLYCARNLVMVQIPGEETERSLTTQPEFSTLFNLRWENRRTPAGSPDARV